MAASTDLTTVAKVRNYINNQAADSTLLDALIDSVSEQIEGWCNRKFKYETVDDRLDGRGESFVIASRPPVDEAQTFQVWDDLDRDFEAADLVDADDYVVYPDTGIVQFDAGTFADGNRNVKVAYTGGFSTIPPAVEQAANMLVADVYNRGQKGGDGIKSETLSRHAIAFADPGKEQLPPVVRALLTPFRRIRL